MSIEDGATIMCLQLDGCTPVDVMRRGIWSIATSYEGVIVHWQRLPNTS